MSAEVSFTKRAAAELSRCFNGLTTSVNRSGSKKSTTSSTVSTSTGAASSSTTSGVASPSSLNTTSSGSLSDPLVVTTPAVTGRDAGPSRGRTQQPHNSETTYLLTSSPSSSPSSNHASPSKKSLFGGQSAGHAVHQQSSPSKKRSSSGSNVGASGPGNMIQTSVQTLITKANTTLSPFRESMHVNGEAVATVHSSKSSSGSEPVTSAACSSSKNHRPNRGPAGTPATPSRRPSGPPPAAPRKTSIARRKNFLLNLEKPHSLEELSKDFPFLNHFFAKYFTPKERTVLSQVCSYWRDVLYNDPSYWSDLVMVINCNDLRRCSPLLIDPSAAPTAHSVSSCNNNNNNNKSKISNPADKRIRMSCSDDNIRSNIYLSMEQRGFDAVCLYGATDSDVIDFASRISPTFTKRITSASLRSSSVSDKGLEIFLAAMNQSLLRLELTGCNEITDSGLWTSLIPNLQSLSISDCINVADETVAAITQMLPALKELNLQAYHVTDAAMSYFGTTPARGNLKCLRLENCWEIGNQGVLNIAHGLPNLVTLSLSGCSKINDDAIEVIAEQLRHLTTLNLSWCSRISDASLEYIACDLADTLRELIIDRCVHVTDIGLGYAATMSRLSSLSIRWCPQIRDFGIQTLCSMKSLKSIALSGCPQLSVSGLSCLVQIASLTEIELTNCAGASPELIQYLKQHLPASTVVIE